MEVIMSGKCRDLWLFHNVKRPADLFNQVPTSKLELLSLAKLQPFHHQHHRVCLMISDIPNMAHLLNPLATTSQIYHKSSFSSLPKDLQDTIFITSQCLTQAAGQLLELPQSVTAQANVILARYWLVDSPMANEFSVRVNPE